MPKPIPHITILQTISHSEYGAELNVNNDNAVNPEKKIAIPMDAMIPGLNFSASLAATGDISIVAIGHGVISSPVVTSENPQ